MKNPLDDEIRSTLEAACLMNRKVFSIDRCVILILLYCCIDGLQYRELKNLLKISDGKLIADLTMLLKNRYVEKREERWDNKKLDVYLINENGIAETHRYKKFFNQYQKLCEANR